VIFLGKNLGVYRRGGEGGGEIRFFVATTKDVAVMVVIVGCTIGNYTKNMEICIGIFGDQLTTRICKYFSYSTKNNGPRVTSFLIFSKQTLQTVRTCQDQFRQIY